MFDDWKQRLSLFVSRIYVRMRYTYEHLDDIVWGWHIDRLHNLNQRTFIILAVVFIVVGYVYLTGVRPPSDFPGEALVTIEEGAPLSEVARHLEEEQVVRSSWWLTLAVRIRGAERDVHAGDYLFAQPRTVFAVARIITTGTFGLEPIRVRIPEGATVTDMAVILDRRLLRFDPEEFIEMAIPLEGYLFPDTYHFLPNASEEQVIRTLEDNFNEHIAPLENQIATSPFTLHEIITLASIIEKEAFNDRDRQLISGVLHNRLDLDMRLQVDATFTYTHNKGTYDITLAELRDEENAYNTYVHKGLPPGPIGSPSMSSIHAALNPIENNYIFYLADRAGTTYYSTTYEEHLRKKRIYID